jgi:hypothetical protein
VSEISLGLWFVGAVLIGLAIFNVRVPLARTRELHQIADNAKRYESWRGSGSRTAAGRDETTGADVMRDILRRQVYIWAGVSAVGILMIAAGVLVR